MSANISVCGPALFYRNITRPVGYFQVFHLVHFECPAEGVVISTESRHPTSSSAEYSPQDQFGALCRPTDEHTTPTADRTPPAAEHTPPKTERSSLIAEQCSPVWVSTEARLARYAAAQEQTLAGSTLFNQSPAERTSPEQTRQSPQLSAQSPNLGESQ